MNNKMTPEEQHKTLLIGDGHVHIHSCFDLNLFWQSAWENFAKAARRYAPKSKFKAVLFLTESQGVDWFSNFKKEASLAQQKERWKFQETEESRCLRVYNDGVGELWLVAGRQIVTAENLEVLGLGIEQYYTDGKPLAEVVEWVHSQGGLAVIPWGVGKWIGARGKYVKELVKNSPSKRLFLGDNGNRPVFWPLSPIFAQGLENGIDNIPGSDPLPLGEESRRPGSYGFMLSEFDFGKEPIRRIFESFVSNEKDLYFYGEREGPIRFFKKQLFLKMAKKKKNRLNSKN